MSVSSILRPPHRRFHSSSGGRTHSPRPRTRRVPRSQGVCRLHTGGAHRKRRARRPPAGTGALLTAATAQQKPSHGGGAVTPAALHGASKTSLPSNPEVPSRGRPPRQFETVSRRYGHPAPHEGHQVLRCLAALARPLGRAPGVLHAVPHRIARLTREAGLVGRCRRPRMRTTIPASSSRPRSTPGMDCRTAAIRAASTCAAKGPLDAMTGGPACSG